MDTITVLNMSHPLTDAQISQMVEMVDAEVQVIDIAVQLDLAQPAAEQISEIIQNITTINWEQDAVIVNLPGYTPAAALVLAEIHGRAGHFPSILRLKPSESAVARYDVAEIINLQHVRDAARVWRSAKK